AELRDIMMLAAVTQTHAPALGASLAPAPPPRADAAEKLAPVIPLAARRRRFVIGAVSALAAAAAVVVAWRGARPRAHRLGAAGKAAGRAGPRARGGAPAPPPPA